LKYIEENTNILIEIVDKKYIIATNIVNCLVSPPYYQPKKNIEVDVDVSVVGGRSQVGGSHGRHRVNVVIVFTGEDEGTAV